MHPRCIVLRGASLEIQPVRPSTDQGRQVPRVYTNLQRSWHCRASIGHRHALIGCLDSSRTLTGKCTSLEDRTTSRLERSWKQMDLFLSLV